MSASVGFRDVCLVKTKTLLLSCRVAKSLVSAESNCGPNLIDKMPTVKLAEPRRCMCSRLPPHRTRKRNASGEPYCVTPKASGPKRGVGGDVAMRGPRNQDQEVQLRVAMEAQLDAEAEVEKQKT